MAFRPPPSPSLSTTTSAAAAAADLNLNHSEEAQIFGSPPPSSSDDASNATPSDDASSWQERFRRVWAEDDEIFILQGLVDYRAVHDGSLPSAKSEFRELNEQIRDLMHDEVSDRVLFRKIRRMERKYSSDIARAGIGSEPVFLKAHEQAAFNLSKRIWGAVVKEDKTEPVFSGAQEEPVLTEAKKTDACKLFLKMFWGVRSDDVQHGGEVGKNMYPTVTRAIDQMGDLFAGDFMRRRLKRRLELIDPEKGEMLEKVWKKQLLDEMDSCIAQVELQKEFLLLIREHLANGDHQ